jgi:hypothetical protein
LTATHKQTSKQEQLDEEYMVLYAPWEMLNNPVKGLILHNCCFSHTQKLKLGYILTEFWVEKKATTGWDPVKHVIRQA